MRIAAIFTQFCSVTCKFIALTGVQVDMFKCMPSEPGTVISTI